MNDFLNASILLQPRFLHPNPKHPNCAAAAVEAMVAGGAQTPMHHLPAPAGNTATPMFEGVVKHVHSSWPGIGSYAFVDISNGDIFLKPGDQVHADGSTPSGPQIRAHELERIGAIWTPF